MGSGEHTVANLANDRGPQDPRVVRGGQRFEQAQALVWTLTCAGSQTPVGSAPLTVAAQGWIFDVPANCPAQTLRLSGVSGDLPKQSDVTIARLQLGQAGNAND